MREARQPPFQRAVDCPHVFNDGAERRFSVATQRSAQLERLLPLREPSVTSAREPRRCGVSSSAMSKIEGIDALCGDDDVSVYHYDCARRAEQLRVGLFINALIP